MCTLTLIASGTGTGGSGGGGYRLAMTRDERGTRAVAEPPAVRSRGNSEWLAPRDPDGGGTWIAADARGRTVAILNGDGPASFAPPPADVQSRGLLAEQLLTAVSFDAALADLGEAASRGTLRFRPFRLVLVEIAAGVPKARTIESEPGRLRVEPLAAPAIVTSNGFAPELVARERRKTFADFLANATCVDRDALIESAELVRLHRGHLAPGERGLSTVDATLASFCLHRAEVQSVSLTLVMAGRDGVTMDYWPGSPCRSGAPSRASLR